MEKRTCVIDGCPKPQRYPRLGLCNGHYLRKLRYGDPLSVKRPPVPTRDRFESKIVRPTPSGCWTWSGGHNAVTGYALFNLPGPDGVWRPRLAHRISYELFVGPIPDGRHIDHLCRNRGCVNPVHLEAVTQQVNMLRGYAPSAVSHRANRCHRGHEFTPENTYIKHRPNGRIKRDCRECARQRDRVRNQTPERREAHRLQTRRRRARPSE